MTLFAALAGALGACRAADSSAIDANGVGGPDGNHAGGPDAAPGAAGSVHSILSPSVASGTMVSLANVTIVARVTSTKSGKLWVQDKGGGPYSGVELFCSFTSATKPCAMNRTQIEALMPGQVINVTGSFNIFSIMGSPPVNEVEQPVITATGTMDTPTAVSVDAATLTKDKFSDAAAAPYFGSYVHVNGGPFVVSSTMATEYSATCTGPKNDAGVGMIGTTFRGFEATAGGGTFDVGLGFYESLTWCLPECGFPCTMQVSSQSFSTLNGIVEPSSGGGASYLEIAPVLDTDLTAM